MPRCFDYINERYNQDDEYVYLGRIITSLVNGFWGTTYLCTGLVPNDDLDELLSSDSSSGYEIQNNGPLPMLDKDEKYENLSYIRGLDDKQYQPLVHCWNNHNKTTFIPIAELLMVYGLTSRNIENRIVWDDLRKPVFAVIDNITKSDYYQERDKGFINSDAYVKIKRDYLEDYAQIKKASVVAFYWEERWIKNTDDFIEKKLSNKEAIEYKIPSNRIKLMRTLLKNYTYNCQTHGRQLVMQPIKRPITNPEPLLLEWPNYKCFIKPKAAMSLRYEKVFVKDKFLLSYEDKSELQIYPESGSVDYDGRWCIIRTDRISRNVISLELNKLYEANPDHVIKHVHSYAITEEEAKKDIEKYGTSNIGLRAKNFVYSLIELFKSIEKICTISNLEFDYEDLINLPWKEIDYSGWYTFPDLYKLSNVVELNCNETFFQSRAKLIYKLIEKISEKNIRKVINQIGFKRDYDLSKYGSLTLFSIFYQLVEISTNKGLNLIKDIEILNDNFDDNFKSESLSYLFALSDIRNYESHSESRELKQKYLDALKTFSINQEENRAIGWGLSVDKLYDNLIESFKSIKLVFEEYLNDNNT